MKIKVCILCGETINHLRAYSFAPPERYQHLVCQPSDLTLPQARKILDINQKELGDAVGVSGLTIADWENFRSNPPQRELTRKFLANWLDRRGVVATLLKLNSMSVLNAKERMAELMQ